MKIIITSILIISCSIASSAATAVKLKMPVIFSDNMVLQRNIPCNIWGWGKSGSQVTVNFNEQKKVTIVKANGGWSLKLDSMKAQADGKKMTIKTKNSILVFKNVVVGDVWICGGQSNMGVTIGRMKKVAPKLWDKDIKNTDLPNLRYMSVREIYSPFKEKRDIRIQQKWIPLNKDIELLRLRPSAIGFIFARRLHIELKIPIGFIRSNIGGSGAEAWMSMKTLRSVKSGNIILNDWARMQKEYNTGESKKYINAQYAKAQAKGNKRNMRRWKNKSPKEPVKSRQHPNAGFNAMIAPITKYSIKGIIWDQGEHNAARAWQYRTLLPLLIADWREYWKQGNSDVAAQLPFYQVQIQDWKRTLDRTKKMPSTGNDVAEIRDAQRHVADITANCEIVCTIDHLEGGNTHPLLKNIPGERLAAVALHKTYKKDIQWRGPTYKSAKIEGDKIRISFNGVGKGLMIGKRQGSHDKGTPASGELDYFAIAGDNNQFVWAKAKIDGKTVLVWNSKVKSPKYVRYAWEANPKGCNLYNQEGWPATPFRTDSLPYKTYKNENVYKKIIWH